MPAAFAAGILHTWIFYGTGRIRMDQQIRSGVISSAEFFAEENAAKIFSGNH